VGLQQNGFVAVALSVLGNQPPNALQPKLPDGIHLRWAFERSHGFPWYGMYLFRRSHSVADRQRRVAHIAVLSIPTGSPIITSSDGVWFSDSTLRLGVFSASGASSTGLDLSGRTFLTLQFPDRVSEVIVGVGFTQATTLQLTADLEQMSVASATLTGQAGQVQTVTLHADSMSSITIDGGPAVLLTLSALPVASGALQGWQAVPSCPYPLCLPVANPTYPCAGAPATAAAAEQLALSRVRYGSASQWGGANFAALHGQLVKLVDGGPAGPAMADRFTANVPVSGGVGPDKMARQYPLDLVLLASLNPAVAQMVGLYWVDSQAVKGSSYDYLVVGALKSNLGASASAALQWLNQNGFDSVDAYIVSNVSLDQSAPPLSPPGGLKTYALPNLPIVPASGPAPADDNHAGLRWDLGQSPNGTLTPGAPVMYHVWRADLGNGTTPTAVSQSDYMLRTASQPVVVVESQTPVSQTGAPLTWPPERIYYADVSLPDGWYSYQVSAIDLFGRHSGNSAAGSWYQWTPAPDPKPWYFVDPPPVGLVVHPFAVRLRDAAPPPAPSGVEAFALDPLDPTVVKDSAYQSWWNALVATSWYQALSAADRNALIGLRVRWRWSADQMAQAPDTREFRLYFQDTPMNTFPGRVITSTVATATETNVTTDINSAFAVDAFKDLGLIVRNNSFKILASQGSPLTLRVRNVGAQDEVRPPANKPCAIVVPPDHPPLPYTDFSQAQSWTERLCVVSYDDVTKWRAEPASENAAGRIYEVFLPDPSGADHAGLSLPTTLADPIKYAWIGVSAADDKTYQSDTLLTGTWGNRYGNEGAVGGPATIFRVRRDPPPTPQLPPADSDRLYATAADYHNRSLYTFRWLPGTDSNGALLPIGYHVFRALDDTIFRTDWQRPVSQRLTLDPNNNPQHRQLFPAQAVEPRWDAQKCQQVADELNALNDLKSGGGSDAAAWNAYRGLSNDAGRVLAGLPGNEVAFSQITVRPLDPNDPTLADQRGPDSAADYVPSTGLRSYLDSLDGRSSNSFFYRAGSVDQAQNRSAGLSLAGPPVSCPDVVPPRAPTITRVLAGDSDPNVAGDGKITVYWASNRESDLAAYRIYRATSVASTRDPRLMTLVTEIQEQRVASARPAEMAWTDSTITPLQTHYYLLVALDVSGNVSTPSPAIAGRAYDDALPAVPQLSAAWTATSPPAQVLLDWNAQVESLLEVRPDNLATWSPGSLWLPSGAQSLSLPLDTGRSWSFRLRVRKATGAIALSQPVSLAKLS
jgi:hypothetical protein